MEPTELAVAPAQAGALNFRVTVPGLAAHGSIREEGVSAIEKFFPIYESLMAFEKARNAHIDNPLFADYRIPYAITIGTLRAGNWASTVAERLEFEGRFGVAVEEDLTTAKRAFEETIIHAASSDPWLREHPPQVDWWGGQFAPAQISPDHTLVTTVSEAFGEVTGKPAVVRGMTYGADMRLLINEGQTPTVLFGPGDVRNAHQPNEFVPISDLLATIQTLALTTLRFCGYENSE
jgi:acetylornithine deacetylase